jgi:hypothetical protein
MKAFRFVSSVLIGATFASPAAAQSARPPVRQLGAIIAKSNEPLVTVAAVRGLSDGRVFLNDPGGRRVLLFDGSLATSTLVADSTSATANAYAGRSAGLIAFRGDSTLFIDPQSSSMLVLDPAGKVARVMSVPRARDAAMLAIPQAGVPGFDPQGRLIYRESPNIRPTFGPNGPIMPDIPDSTSVIRVDLATRKVDTIGFAKIPKVKLNIERTDNNVRVTTMVNPLPVVDDWAVLPDGSVAFVRGSDYHVDWVNADGTKVSSPKVPFDWQRLSDADKVAFIDSVKAARARIVASQPATTGGPATGAAVPGGAPVGGRVQIIGGPGGGVGGGGGPGNGGGGGNFGFQPTFVDPSELPDYKPPFFAGSTRADTEGNLWVRTIPTKFIAGGPVYDVINRKGELVDRVQVPVNTLLAGFGPNGTVYLALTDNKTVYLESAHVR